MTDYTPEWGFNKSSDPIEIMDMRTGLPVCVLAPMPDKSEYRRLAKLIASAPRLKEERDELLATLIRLIDAIKADCVESSGINEARKCASIIIAKVEK